MDFLDRISRTERSGRYGSDQSRGDSEWRERRGRDQDREPDRDHDMRRWGEDRRGDRYDGDRRGNRDQSPEVEAHSSHCFFPCTAEDVYSWTATILSSCPPNLLISVHRSTRESEKGGIVTDQKTAITLMETTPSRISVEKPEMIGRARPSCFGGCLITSLRMK